MKIDNFIELITMGNPHRSSILIFAELNMLFIEMQASYECYITICNNENYYYISCVHFEPIILIDEQTKQVHPA